ncbi:MAG: response regulator [Actinomycetia bacterium]|nr:response regulator [Actinomycetes bacterium]
MIENVDLAASVTQALLARSGLGDIKVTRFRSLAEAESHLRDGHSEAILVDLGLPDAAGDEVVPAVRHLAPATPIVVLSGDQNDSRAAQSLREGAQDYVVKGTIDAAMLGRTVRLALARTDAERALRLSVVKLLVRSDDLWEEIERRGEVEDELREEREQLSDLILQLKKANNVRTDFIATVSHELRTPLTSIIGFADILTEMPAVAESADALSALEVVERNGRRLLALVEDLLITADLDSDATRTARERMHLHTVIDSVVSSVQPIVAERDQQLTTAIDSDLPLIWGDQIQLERALLNIVGNAMKFTPAGGSISVSAKPKPDGSAIEISTTDTGPGIEPADIDRLFGRFVRGDTAVANEIPGTGLGLGIVKAIMEAHGGEALVRSEVGVGTEVVLVVPIDRRQPVVSDSPQSSPSSDQTVGEDQ